MSAACCFGYMDDGIYAVPLLFFPVFWWIGQEYCGRQALELKPMAHRWKAASFSLTLVLLGGLSIWAVQNGGLSMAFFGPKVALDPSRPNILVIYTDDQKFSDIDWFAKKGGGRTPAMDGLFKDGVWLSNARVTTSMCTPSRYSLHTGTYASRSFAQSPGIMKANAKGWPSVENRADLILHGYEAAAGKIFQQAGYQTAFIGKWHLSGLHWGGDERPNLEDLQQVDESKVRRLGGFDVVGGLYMTNILWQAKSLGLESELAVHNPALLTENAVDFIQTAVRNPNKAPFFMIYAPTLVHSPYVKGRDDERAGPYGRLEQRPSPRVSWSEIERRVGGKVKRQDRAVIALDYSIGKIVEALKDQGVYKNTLIVFMSDNNQAKSSIFDDGVRVPSALFWDGRLAPGVSEALFANVDILPTVLEAAGVAYDPAQFDGLSAWPAIAHSQAAPRSRLLLEQGYARSLVTQDGWKYVRVDRPASLVDGSAVESSSLEGTPVDASTSEDGRFDYSARPVSAQRHTARQVWNVHAGFFEDEQLYDLSQDPDETRNLAQHAAHQQRLADMRALMAREMARVMAAAAPR